MTASQSRLAARRPLAALEAAEERHGRYAWTNAFLYVDYDRARQRLAAVLASEATTASPLRGTLFSAKDLLATRGIPTTAGSLLLRDNVPNRDAVAVARLQDAGAVLVGKGSCAEFGFGIDTENRLGGRVLHPFEPAASPGGSSGGDAVAVATGCVDVALATDYGGSTRWPAQALGILGLRTGVGRVPRTGQIPGCGGATGDAGLALRNPWSLSGALDTIGILARTPSQIADVFDQVRGPDGFDWLTGAGGIPRSAPTRRHRVRRLALSTGAEILPGVELLSGAWERFRKAVHSTDHELVDANGVLEGAFEIYARLRAQLDHHLDIAELIAGREDLLFPESRRVLAAAGTGTPTAGVIRDWAARETITQRVRALLETVDVLVLPVAPTGPLAHGELPTVAGRTLSSDELMSYCRAVSLTGLPSLSVPFDDAPPGHGISLQLVGPPGGERLCCEVAQELGRGAGLSWAAVDDSAVDDS